MPILIFVCRSSKIQWSLRSSLQRDAAMPFMLCSRLCWSQTLLFNLKVVSQQKRSAELWRFWPQLWLRVQLQLKARLTSHFKTWRNRLSFLTLPNLEVHGPVHGANCYKSHRHLLQPYVLACLRKFQLWKEWIGIKQIKCATCTREASCQAWAWAVIPWSPLTKKNRKERTRKRRKESRKEPKIPKAAKVKAVEPVEAVKRREREREMMMMMMVRKQKQMKQKPNQLPLFPLTPSTSIAWAPRQAPALAPAATFWTTLLTLLPWRYILWIPPSWTQSRRSCKLCCGQLTDHIWQTMPPSLLRFRLTFPKKAPTKLFCRRTQFRKRTSKCWWQALWAYIHMANRARVITPCVRFLVWLSTSMGQKIWGLWTQWCQHGPQRLLPEMIKHSFSWPTSMPKPCCTWPKTVSFICVGQTASPIILWSLSMWTRPFLRWTPKKRTRLWRILRIWLSWTWTATVR